MTIKEVANYIKPKSTAKRRPVLIAIDGFGGSGKSTIAEKLKNVLDDAYVVSIDDFIVKEKILEASWDKGGFDRERLEKQVLMPVVKGEPVVYQRLIWQTNELSEAIAVPDVQYLIIEGITSCHPDIVKYYDYKIWVDTPIEIAKQRGRARDAQNENSVHWDLWAANDLEYQNTYHPEQNADFIVDNK